MTFKDVAGQQQAVPLLQRSLEQGRLAHAYLFTGSRLDDLEAAARVLAKTLNCLQPVKKGAAAIDACDQCLNCAKIEHDNHPDVHWVRPESKTRIITTGQMRELMKEIQLKPSGAEWKIAIIVAADRLRPEAANAFLKTLEEPPNRSILILLTTEPQRLLETIVSRCLRLNFGGHPVGQLTPEQADWLSAFSQMAGEGEKSLMGRYRLLDLLLQKLAGLRQAIEEALTARSPLQQYKDAEKEWIEKWEDELAAAIEADYRRQRGELLAVLHWWLRDVWLHALGAAGADSATLLSYPQLAGADRVGRRITATDALENLRILEQLQRRLHTNVQEALALEIGLLKLRL